MDTNLVILHGNLTKDVELFKLDNEQSVANFIIATKRKYSSKEWVEKEEREFHRCSIYWKRAETLWEIGKKWTRIMVQWRIKNNVSEKDWERKYYTEIVVDKFGL